MRSFLPFRCGTASRIVTDSFSANAPSKTGGGAMRADGAWFGTLWNHLPVGVGNNTFSVSQRPDRRPAHARFIPTSAFTRSGIISGRRLRGMPDYASTISS